MPKYKKYTGEIDSRLLMWLEKYGVDASELLVDEDGGLHYMYHEDEGSRHPDDPTRPASYPLPVELDEFDNE